MAAGYTLGREPSGAERLVVAVKGTFTLPTHGEEPTLAEEQVPLTDADKFTGEPGLSAVTAECDWAPMKPRCDILLNGSAYAPGGKPAQRVQVGIKVDNWHPDPTQHRTYLPNPVGRGYHRLLEPYLVDNTPMPNTEESNAPVTTPNGDYRPMSFGVIGRNFLARYPLAGTYDQNWQDNVFPFLPADFNAAYFQSVPPDQQVEKIVGGEPVILLNLTSDGRRDFRLPAVETPVVFFLRD